MKSFARRLAMCVSLLGGGAAVAGTIYGDVVSSKGQPLPKKVSFIDDSGRRETVTPDASGHYEVTLPPGHYRIESEAGSAAPAAIDVFHEPRQQKIVVTETK